jgi:hypothetical protein
MGIYFFHHLFLAPLKLTRHMKPNDLISHVFTSGAMGLSGICFLLPACILTIVSCFLRRISLISRGKDGLPANGFDTLYIFGSLFPFHLRTAEH